MNALLNTFGVDVMPELQGFLQAAWNVLLVVALAWVVWHTCARLIRMGQGRMARSASTDQAKRVETITQMFRYAVAATILVVGGMLVLDQLGISIAPLIATAGVAGIAIGFGVQSLVKDYFTGPRVMLIGKGKQCLCNLKNKSTTPAFRSPTRHSTCACATAT